MYLDSDGETNKSLNHEGSCAGTDVSVVLHLLLYFTPFFSNWN